MWKSKLGTVYPKAEIDAMDAQMQKKLKALRNLPGNKKCADCGANGTVWAIVNLGTFVCMRCASLHRSLGTHISVPKGCTGTYLWGPDELEAMKGGNDRAKDRWGTKMLSGVSDAQMRQFLIDKYTAKYTAKPVVAVGDLLEFEDEAEPDFFGQYGVN